MSLNLLGLGHFNPENEITNQFLEDLDIGTNDEWIMERTGIRSRRTALPLEYIRETRNADPRGAVEAAEISNAAMGARAAARAPIAAFEISAASTAPRGSAFRVSRIYSRGSAVRRLRIPVRSMIHSSLVPMSRSSRN